MPVSILFSGSEFFPGRRPIGDEVSHICHWAILVSTLLSVNFVLARTMTFFVPIEIVSASGYMGIPEKPRQKKLWHLHRLCKYRSCVPPTFLLQAYMKSSTWICCLCINFKASVKLQHKNCSKFSTWLGFICQSSFYKLWGSRDYHSFIHPFDCS